MFRLTRLHAAILGAWAAAAGPVVWAQEATPEPAKTSEVVSLPSVVITATRRPTPALTTPATVSVIDETQLQETG